MITSAKAIAESVGQVMKYAQEIASKCKDPKLRENILSAAGIPKDLAIQVRQIHECIN